MDVVAHPRLPAAPRNDAPERAFAEGSAQDAPREPVRPSEHVAREHLVSAAWRAVVHEHERLRREALSTVYVRPEHEARVRVEQVVPFAVHRGEVDPLPAPLVPEDELVEH